MTDATGATEATGTVQPGETVYYKVTVTNTGDEPVSAVNVTEIPGTGLAYVAGVALDGAGVVTDRTDGAIWGGWTLANKGDSASMVVTCRVHDNATGTVINTARTPKSVVVVDTPIENIVVHKTTDGTITTEGGKNYVTYDVTVTNNGDADSANVVVDDTPSGLVYDSCTPPAGVSAAANGSGGVTFTIASLAKGASVTVTGVRFEVTSTIGYTNTVHREDYQSYVLSKQRVTNANGDTAATDTVQSGQTVYYKVMLTNTGSIVVPAGVQVTDTFENLTYTGTDPAVTANPDGTLTWTAPSIDVNGNRYVVLQFKVNDGVSLVKNTATIPHTEIVVTDPVPHHEVSKTLTNGDEVTKAGDTATYQITVHNTNNVAGTNVKVIDTATGVTIPDGSTYDMDNGGTASYDASTNQFTLSGIGASATVTFSVGVPVESFPITNRAVTPVSDQKYALDKVRVDASGNPVPANTAVWAGETVYYQVTVANTSATDALASQTVTDAASAGLKIQSATAGTVSPDGTTLTWDTGDIAPSGSATVTVTALVTPAAAGLVTNAASTPTDVVVVTDPVSGSVYVTPQVEKVIAGDTPTQNATFAFTLTAADATTPMPDGKTGGSVTASREGAGTASFGQIEFDRPGTYSYTVSEVQGTADGYGYDTTSYTMAVVVEAGENGVLTISSSYVGPSGPTDAMVFTNRYTAPRLLGFLPTTGDATFWTLTALLGLAMAGAIIVVIALLYRRRRNKA